jgi:hypothetical protein
MNHYKSQITKVLVLFFFLLMLVSCDQKKNNGSILGIPVNFSAVAGSGEITLTWDLIGDAQSYNIYLATESGISKENYSSLAGGTKYTGITSPYIITSLINSTTYYLIITAVYSQGESGSSAEIEITPEASYGTVSDSPQNLKAVVSGTSITVTWDPAANATGYNLYLATETGVNSSNYQSKADGKKIEDISSGCKISNLTSSNIYYLIITAINTAGQEKASSEISVNLNNSLSMATLIVNLDSRGNIETTEERLFNAWDGTRAAQATPAPPIASSSYDFSAVFSIIDRENKKQQITVYFDHTTKENKWEYLITCDPEKDMRTLNNAETTIYSPDTRYNYQNHKGASALQYGIIDFSTAGSISTIAAWNVPPDGKVDPALNINRIILESTEKYYKFPVNFSTSTNNEFVLINFGAYYTGVSTNSRQILISDSGAFSNQAADTYIDAATLLGSVYDSSSKPLKKGDVLVFEGYRHDGATQDRLVYEIDPARTIQDLLESLEFSFGCSAEIDSKGRLKLSDSHGGDSGMHVSRFLTISEDNAAPFGGSPGGINNWQITSSGVNNNDGSTVITDSSLALT